MNNPPAIERLVANLKRLPGIGEKSATRLTFFLLGAQDELVSELAESLARLKQETKLCDGCYTLCEEAPCSICSDERRDGSLLCVVEEPADLGSIEKSGGFTGRYHVLGGALSPIDGVGPDNLRIDELAGRVSSGQIAEVILATNPNAEGDATAHFIADRLSSTAVRITRIACGMPLGGDLEYADHVTVARSLENRRSFR